MEEVNLPEIKNSFLKSDCQSNINESQFKCFEFKLFKYVYNTAEDDFNSLRFNIKTSQENIHKKFIKGLDYQECIYQKNIFGICDLEVNIDSVFSLILKEVTDPFYIFQVFSIILWLCNNYAKYAYVIIVTTLISLIISVYETRVNLVSIKKMARYSCKINVFRKTQVKIFIFQMDCNYF